MGGIVSGITGAIGGLLGGGGQSSPSQPNVQIYQPGGTPTIDSQLQQLLTQQFGNVSGSSNPFTQYGPQFSQVFQSLFNNPATSGYSAAGINAGNAYNAVGNAGVNASTGISNAALAGLPGATSVLNMGLDPQSQLYAQMLQKATDVGNVTNAMYGLTGQQAAGNEAQNINNFNMDWQNQQLSRALAGLSGYGSAIDNAGKGAVLGQGVGGQAAQDILAGGSTPYGVGQVIGGDQNAALLSYISSLLGPGTSAQGAIDNLGSYLGQSINASGQAANQAAQDYYAQLQSQSNLGSGLGGLLNFMTPGASGSSGAGNLFGGLGSLFSSGGAAGAAGAAGSATAADAAAVSPELIDIASMFAAAA